jgi:hypothetical protein
VATPSSRPVDPSIQISPPPVASDRGQIRRLRDILPTAEPASEPISTALVILVMLVAGAVALVGVMTPRLGFSGLSMNRARMRLHRLRDKGADEWQFALDRLSSLRHRRRRW